MRACLGLFATHANLIIISDNGDLLTAADTPHDGSWEAMLKALADLSAKATQSGHAITSAGLMLPDNLSEIPQLEGRDIRRGCQAALGVPVYLASMAQAMTLAEAKLGAGQGGGLIFGALIAQHCAAGVVINGQLLSGARGLAGQWAHCPLPWPVPHELDGHACSCGRDGCLTTYISGAGITAEYYLLTQSEIDASEVLARAAAGDILAESVMQVFEDRLARATALMINLFDPDRIVLGGALVQLDRLFENIPRKWPGYVNGPAPRTQICPAALGPDDMLKGVHFLS